jgi:hypothetical protein
LFHNKRQQKEMEVPEIWHFLAHLAVQQLKDLITTGNAATQKQNNDIALEMRADYAQIGF